MSLDLLFPNFETLIRTPEDVARLNEAILGLAVQGKLVPQDPADEPASELLKRLRAEKQRLIQTKMISDRSEDVSIDEAKIPYALPKAWRWVAVADVCHFERGISFPANAKEEIPTVENVACLRTTNVQEEVDWRDLIYVSPSYVSGEAKKVRLHDILISMANSYELVGKVSYVGRVPFAATFGGFIAALRCFQGMFPKYLYYCLKSALMQGLLRATSSQTTNIANISLRGTYPLPFPLPPLAEQHRIVAKVESLFAQTRALEAKLRQAQADIVTVNRAALNRLSVATDDDAFAAARRTVADAFDLLYDDPRNVAELRQAILQLAVQGKLVPQDPADEPASELLKRIRAEKRRLAEKKAAQHNAPSSESGAHAYELPSGWIWTRLGMLVESMTNGLYKPASFDSDNGVVCLRMYNIQNGKIILDTVRRLDLTREEIGAYGLVEGDIVLNRVNSRELVGKSGLVRAVPEPMAYESMNMRLRFVEKQQLPEYVNLCLMSRSMKEKLLGQAKQAIGQASINQQQVANLPIPLPPLTEQHRIVAKVYLLMRQCDALEDGLARAEGQRRALTAAVTEPD